MQRNPAALTDGEFDLLVIGGGAFGAAAAWDASLRGLRVALIERNDFGGGASAECFKMVHGGIRYLQHADIKRLRSSCRERSAMLRIAPHLVSPLPILIPTYGYGRKGKPFLGTGMTVYDLLTLDRNSDIPDQTRRIQGTRFLGRSEVLEMYPDLAEPTLTGGAVFDDGQMYSPPRLVLAFIKSAVAKGATACNHVEATDFLWKGNRVVGARVRDRIDGTEFDVRARLVLNAAGPGAEYLLERDPRFGKWQRGAFSRDACFIIKRPPRSRYALALQGQTRDRDSLLAREARHMFIVPWRNYTLVGVWHKLFPKHPDDAQVEEEEIEAWIQEIDACYPTLELKRDDVTIANCGLVPFGQGTGTAQELSFGKESRYVDHSTVHGVEGLVTLIGIRYTTCRGDSAKALDLLLRQLPKAPGRSDTERTHLIGGAIADFESFSKQAHQRRPAALPAATLDALLRNHGTEFESVVATAQANPIDAALLPGSTTLTAEVTRAVQAEQAVRLDDVVLRRTDLASAGYPGSAAIEATAQRMQQLLSWSDARRQAEIDSLNAVMRKHLAATPGITQA